MKLITERSKSWSVCAYWYRSLMLCWLDCCKDGPTSLFMVVQNYFFRLAELSWSSFSVCFGVGSFSVSWSLFTKSTICISFVSFLSSISFSR